MAALACPSSLLLPAVARRQGFPLRPAYPGERTVALKCSLAQKPPTSLRRVRAANPRRPKRENRLVFKASSDAETQSQGEDQVPRHPPTDPDSLSNAQGESRPQPSSTHGQDHVDESMPSMSQEVQLRRRSVAVVLPLLAAVTTISRAAAQMAAPTQVLEAPPSTDVEADKTEQDNEGPLSPTASKVSLKILEGCTLGVSFYPDFGYNPNGGGGEGVATDLGDGRLGVTFDPTTLNIPPLSFDSTTFVGMPLPPPLKISIVPTTLSGIIDRRTGQVDLVFKSKFYFTAGPVYSAPPLRVETVLTTESSTGSLREGQGIRLTAGGQATLVAVAVVPPVNDGFLNRFLSLPTEVLAVLPAQFTFET